MLHLARYLGLRFEEAALLRPWKDLQGSRVWIKRGTKGGRPRYLYLHNREQAAALRLARNLCAKDRGLIPREFATYEQWRQHVYQVLRPAGLSRESGTTFHDLRRSFVRDRMDYLTGARGLKSWQAATIVAREVGHHRIEVLRWYLNNSG
jgi:hypothetical protein